jgi:hypothetical protein
MELLSVAQKYEMNSVLTHIRGSLALQTRLSSARRTLSSPTHFAQRYGLRKEATQAARLTLKFMFTIESLELRVIPGPISTNFGNITKGSEPSSLSDLSWHGAAATFNTVLNKFDCTQDTWVRIYVDSIIGCPSLFDPIEFQMALARHTTKHNLFNFGLLVAGCSSCAKIPVETIRTFWTALSAAVHHCMEKVSTQM